ncbi:hypothetical protein BSYN_17520 [Bacteroides sedimenti]|uniref:SusD/RagB family nutrient-binding outer membrane lipoprotein n=2 Tax=Bacteroides sedimenti TaxID=2136147 RepID=A0ABN6Z4K3_9BACE
MNLYMKHNIIFKKGRFFITLLSVVALFSCTDGFETLNTYPLEPPYVPGSTDPGQTDNDINLPDTISKTELNSLKQGANSIGALFRNYSYQGLVNDYQRTTNLTHDIYGGYFATNKVDFLNCSPNYIYTDGWSAKRWDHFYKERCAEYKTLARTFKYVNSEAYRNAYYITRIYFVFLTSTMTDTYGDMPFTPYLQCASIPEKVPYDTQKVVYDKMLRILKQATDSIKPGKCSFKFSSSEDKCYQGDEEKWLRFANTLRLRLALRISNIDPVRAKQEGEAALTQTYGVMKSQEDRMKTIPAYAPVAMGGDNDGGNENEVANCSFRYVDAVMSKDLELAYKNQSNILDPRCEISWYRPTPMELLSVGIEFTEQDYNGCEIGSSAIEHASDVYSVLRVNSTDDKSILKDDYWFGYSREYLWLGYSECLFLKAEAALRGWGGVGQTPEELFKEGIRANFDYYHLPATKATNYINGLKIYSGAIENPFATGNKESQLEQIITQKWLSIFPNGNEGWAEFRRTDYPRLRNHLNNLDGNIPGKKFINRVRYPNDEYDYNPENVPSFGTVNQSTRVWWDVEDTNAASGERNSINNFR